MCTLQNVYLLLLHSYVNLFDMELELQLELKKQNTHTQKTKTKKKKNKKNTQKNHKKTNTNKKTTTKNTQKKQTNKQTNFVVLVDKDQILSIQFQCHWLFVLKKTDVCKIFTLDPPLMLFRLR